MVVPMIPQGKLVPLFKKTVGLDLGNPPTQLEANEAESIVPLASCSNMDVLRNGTLIRRDGEELLFDVLHARDLWAEGEFCFFIAQDEMYQILPNFEKKLVRHSLSLGLSMYFCRVGTRVYYSNTVDSGYIQSSTDYPWDVTPYRGPATDLSCAWSSPAAGTGVLAEGVDAKAPEGMPSRAMVLISARTGSGESARLPATGRVSVAGMTRAAVITARTLTP